MRKYKKPSLKVWTLILANILLYVVLLVSAIKGNIVERGTANLFVRNELTPTKCLKYAPYGMLYRKQGMYDYLIFPMFNDSVAEYYAYMLDERTFRKNRNMHEQPVSLDIAAFEKTSFIDMAFAKDTLDQWCYKTDGENLCFLAGKEFENVERFAARMDSITAYLKCVLGVKDESVR